MIKTTIKKMNTKAYGYGWDASDMPSPITVDSAVENTSIWWEAEFDSDTVYKLIQDIETVRQNGFTHLTLYFNSIGGSMIALRTLVDYIDHKIEGLEVTIAVNGMVASAGFYLLLMVENPKVKIEFDEYEASGLIHLADCLQSGRDSLTRESGRYNFGKFRQQHLEILNERLTKDYLEKLDLSEEDKDKLAQGHDVMLNAEELSRVIFKFREDRYLESDACQEEVVDLISVYEDIKDRIKYLVGKTPEQVLEEMYDFDLDNEDTKKVVENDI